MKWRNCFHRRLSSLVSFSLFLCVCVCLYVHDSLCSFLISLLHVTFLLSIFSFLSFSFTLSHFLFFIASFPVSVCLHFLQIRWFHLGIFFIPHSTANNNKRHRFNFMDVCSGRHCCKSLPTLSCLCFQTGK